MYVQHTEFLFVIFWCRCYGVNGFDWCQDPKANVCQSISKTPARIWNIIEDVRVAASQLSADTAKAIDNLLYRRLVHKVFEAQSVRIPILKFVVIGQKTEKEEGLERPLCFIGIVDILQGFSIQ